VNQVEHAAAGGLMGYGTAQNETFRQLGVYAGKILRGVKPTDLPVWQTVKVDLVINLKTATCSPDKVIGVPGR
jgi:putative tryptophan/tyrosine transport system substrate-binding protein